MATAACCLAASIISFQLSGGCHPIVNQRLRVATMTALFIRKAITVVRPIAVKPSIAEASLFH